MELSVFDIIGNGVSNQEISDSITQKLKDKYNEDFSVKMIGNRYGTATNDSVTVYCFPRSDEKILFTASLNKEQTILEDDYYLKKVSCILQDAFESNFKKEDIDIVAKIKIIGVNQLKEEIDIEKFIRNYENSTFLAKFVCSKEVDEEILKNIYTNIGKEYENINLKSAVYFMDTSDFEEFKKVSEKIPDVTESIIQKYNSKEEKLIKISGGNIVVIK